MARKRAASHETGAAKMNAEHEMDRYAAVTDANLSVAANLLALIPGWKAERTYVAKRGSVYLTLVSLCENQYITKVRIADHEEMSDSHVAAEVTILNGGSFGEPDLDAAAQAINENEQGVF
jgi:hypothetical protein